MDKQTSQYQDLSDHWHRHKTEEPTSESAGRSDEGESLKTR